MHNTIATLKNGKKISGPIMKWRPEEGWFTLADNDRDCRIRFNQCKSIVTPGERIGPGKLGEDDDLARAREHMKDGRRLGWFKKTVPKMKWEG